MYNLTQKQLDKLNDKLIELNKRGYILTRILYLDSSIMAVVFYNKTTANTYHFGIDESGYCHSQLF